MPEIFSLNCSDQKSNAKANDDHHEIIYHLHMVLVKEQRTEYQESGKTQHIPALDKKNETRDHRRCISHGCEFGYVPNHRNNGVVRSKGVSQRAEYPYP